jgi:transposase-like protein
MKKKKEFNFQEFEKQALEKLKNGAPLTGDDGVFTPLIKRFLEASMEGELNAHLAEEEVANRRNGKMGKTVKTSLGNVQVNTPRDRNSSFEPQIIKKRQTVLNDEIDQKIISMYSLGMSYSDIRSHLLEMYGLETSESTLTGITDQVISDVEDWQNRPLESVYPIVWMDAIHYKVREENRIKTKAVYCIIGLNREGIKDILGMYIGQAEGARFWLSILTQLKERGVNDIFIACIDNLSGFSEAIEAIFPQTDVQLCVVHQVRNTMRYVPWKESRTVVLDMKKIYRAPTQEQSKKMLEEFSLKWKSKYPHTVKSWQVNWDRLTNFYKYPLEIRKMIYTTNIIENFHAQLRKVTKTKRSFSSDISLLKLLYLVQDRYVQKKWMNPVFGWKQIQSQFIIIFDERFNADTVY